MLELLEEMSTVIQDELMFCPEKYTSQEYQQQEVAKIQSKTGKSRTRELLMEMGLE
jgi:hypothetical protein